MKMTLVDIKMVKCWQFFVVHANAITMIINYDLPNQAEHRAQVKRGCCLDTHPPTSTQEEVLSL